MRNQAYRRFNRLTGQWEATKRNVRELPKDGKKGT